MSENSKNPDFHALATVIVRNVRHTTAVTEAVPTAVNNLNYITISEYL